MKTAWAIKLTFSPLDGERTYLAGSLLFGDRRTCEPQETKLFFLRKDAEAALRELRQTSPWAFRGKWASEGGTRIYKKAEPVRVNIQITEAA